MRASLHASTRAHKQMLGETGSLQDAAVSIWTPSSQREMCAQSRMLYVSVYKYPDMSGG